MAYTDEAELHDLFSHHPPSHDGIVRAHDHMRGYAEALAAYIAKTCPESPERNNALDKVQEAMFWGNAAIARHQNRTDDEP